MENLWNQVLDRVRSRINPQSYETWLAPTKQLSFEDGVLTVRVPSKFVKNWIVENYIDVLVRAAAESSSQGVSVEFKVDEGLPFPSGGEVGRREADNPVPGRESRPTNLNPSYTFESFVVGTSNEFAHAASLAVANTPARNYNPLFIYGGVGLGKTHLMHAIGQQVVAQQAGLSISYTTSEQFVNELIAAIQHDRMPAFRNRYRNIDVLLVDDIQFLAGKDRTQEEFFHTFNSLYESRKQIVISSDRIPKDITSMEERLRSRFEWGLIADIQPPDLETKIAILKRKAEEKQIDLPAEVALLIAEKIRSNVRELEGSLTRISAYASLRGKPISTELADACLREMFYKEDRIITIEAIQRAVAEYFGVTLSDLKSKKRQKSIAVPRQIAMFLARELTAASLPDIGKKFGGKDHTTVLHSCNKIRNCCDEGGEIARSVRALRGKIEG